jgi:hypothetical protein
LAARHAPLRAAAGNALHTTHNTQHAQAAALEGKARDSTGKLLEYSTGAPWRHALLQRLGLFGGKKPNLQVRACGAAALSGSGLSFCGKVRGVC